MSSNPNSANYVDSFLKPRFELDRCQLEREYGDLGQLSGIEGPLSDLHEDFSAVYVLRFVNGKRVVYKPRRLRSDSIYAQLCHELFDITSGKLVERDSYGWMHYYQEEIPLPKHDFLLGQQLALLTVLRSSDHHSENLIVSEGFPRFIDMECTLAPEMTFARRPSTLFSPRATRIFQQPKWSYSLDRLTRGYLAGLKAIEENSKSVGERLNELASEPARVLLRNTRFYAELIQNRRHHMNFEHLRVALLADASSFPELANYEAECLWQGRVPRFTYRPSSQVLEAEGLVFKNLISHPGLALAIDALNNLTKLANSL
jgi:lantibiotic modifying enzyme